MLKIILVFLSLFVIACSNFESNFGLNWKEFTFKEAGFKAEFPCEPKKEFNSFQDEPRKIHTYSIGCEIEGIKFYISSKHYMDEFNENSISEFFESMDWGNKQFYGGMKETARKDVETYPNAEGRYYKLENENGVILDHLAIANNERFYSIITAFSTNTKSDKKVQKEYDVFQKFRDSFVIIPEQ